MAYREDEDLEFLQECDNDDLDLLVNTLIKDKDEKLRFTESLTINERYQDKQVQMQ